MRYLFVFLVLLFVRGLVVAQPPEFNIYDKFSVANYVEFDFGLATLDAQDKQSLDGIASLWRRFADEWGELKMVFKGYTCPEEMEADPYLYLKRCRVVLDYLMLRSNIDYRYFMIAALPVVENFWEGRCTRSGVSFSF
jgi:hypothetical protein